MSKVHDILILAEQQHEIILNMVICLKRIIAAGKPYEKLHAHLDDWEHAITEHLKTEDELIHAVSIYPHKERHLKDHDDFLKRMSKTIKDMKQTEDSLCLLEILIGFNTYVTTHFNVVDGELFMYAKKEIDAAKNL